MFKPELLLPAGSIEAFHAALDAGADAIYLGLKRFNARNRARNFVIEQLPTLVKKAEEKNVKVLVTLNTVVKNNELSELISYLHKLQQAKPYAVIVQDLGVVYIIRQYFPDLKVHASTQMNFHNSLGAQLAPKVGIDRVVLARELTRNEVGAVAQKSKVELEVFIHGALCYSVSGMCLFSSYLGGSGANRGMCAQPCRRLYSADDHKPASYLFSLKDNMQFDSLKFLQKNRITSLKVEGRMKPANYVYNVGTQYRSFIDGGEGVQEEHDENFDFTREKTGYFLGGKAKDNFTKHPNTGEYIGQVVKNAPGELSLKLSKPIDKGFRIRLTDESRDAQVNIKVKEVVESGGVYTLTDVDKDVSGLRHVYLLATENLKFPSRFDRIVPFHPNEVNASFKKKILNSFKLPQQNQRPKLLVRIDNVAWLKKLYLDDFDVILLKFSKRSFGEFDPQKTFVQKFAQKFVVELPGFIFEHRIAYYRDLLLQYKKCGINKVMIGNISQLELVPCGMEVLASESVYSFNDAAVKMLDTLGVKQVVYPYENDFENLELFRNKNGVVPVYFCPKLFYARMPVRVKNGEVYDDQNLRYKVVTKDNMTSVYPEVPVALTQYRRKLEELGFKNFLFDLSSVVPSKHLPKKVLQKWNASEQLQPSNSFNFKRGLA